MLAMQNNLVFEHNDAKQVHRSLVSCSAIEARPTGRFVPSLNLAPALVRGEGRAAHNVPGMVRRHEGGV